MKLDLPASNEPALGAQALRHTVFPPGRSSRTIPAAASSSRILSDSAQSLALRAAARASISLSISSSPKPTVITPPVIAIEPLPGVVARSPTLRFGNRNHEDGGIVSNP